MGGGAGMFNSRRIRFPGEERIRWNSSLVNSPRSCISRKRANWSPVVGLPRSLPLPQAVEQRIRHDPHSNKLATARVSQKRVNHFSAGVVGSAGGSAAAHKTAIFFTPVLGCRRLLRAFGRMGTGTSKTRSQSPFFRTLLTSHHSHHRRVVEVR